MRQILLKISEHRISTFPLLIGFKDVLLAKIRNKLLEALKEFKMQQTLIRLLKYTMKHGRNKVTIKMVVLEKVIRNSEIETKGFIYTIKVPRYLLMQVI